MDIIKKTIPSVGNGTEKLQCPFIIGRNVNLQSLLQDSLWLLKTLNLPCDSAVPLQGFYSGGMSLLSILNPWVDAHNTETIASLTFR